jgi:excisionase family DNA binding protein
LPEDISALSQDEFAGFEYQIVALQAAPKWTGVRAMGEEQAALAPLAVSVEDAARILGCGRTTVYGLMRDGHLPSVVLRRRRLVRVEDLQQFIAALPQADV